VIVRRVMLLALVALLVAAPAAEAAKRRVPHGFYGVMWDRAGASAPDAVQEQQWGLMASSGVESVRTVFSWARAQPDPNGLTSYVATDALVARAARHGQRLLPVVLWAPDWARAYPERAASPPAREEDFASYLTALIGRYGPEGTFWSEHPELPRLPVREWQLWNEPHLDSYWLTPDGPWAPGYAKLLKAGYKAVKAADPGARVVTAALADYAWRHLDKIYAQRARRSFDVAAINFFSARPRNVLKALRFVRKTMRENHDGRKQVWLTEVTWPAAKGRDKPRARWQKPWVQTDGGMARRVIQVYKLLARERRKVRLGRVYWYTWSSAYEPGDLFDFGGLTRYTDGSFESRPALDAYRRSALRNQGCAKSDTGACL
jgi:polysaccharide biosynthesis protein PslG